MLPETQVAIPGPAHKTTGQQPRRVYQVGIALGGADLDVAEQPPVFFYRRATGNNQQSVGVAHVIDAGVETQDSNVVAQGLKDKFGVPNSCERFSQSIENY